MSQYLHVKVINIINETAAAKTFVLVTEDGKPVPYQAGQFLTFIFSVNGTLYRRSYSLSSSPETDAHLAITVKRVQYGRISHHIINQLKVGTLLQCLPPAGRFILPDKQAPVSRDVFLIAAGSGITPIFSILKTLLKKEPESQITLIYSNRNEATTLFYDTLNQYALTYQDRFRCLHIMSQPADKSQVYHGHLNTFLLEELVGQHLHFKKEHALVFVCGPHAVMRMVYMKLSIMGFQKAHIFREQFVVRDEVKSAPVPRVADPSDKTVVIHYQHRAYSLTVPYGKSILQAGLDHHIDLPYSCRAGICSTCTATCREGKVVMSNNEVLTEKDIRSGLILTCVGYPHSHKVVIDFKGID